MSSYHVTRRKGYEYVCKSDSFWDKDRKQPRNKKVTIGTIDKNTNKIIFRDSFLINYKENTITISGKVIQINNPYFYKDEINNTINHNNENEINAIQNNCISNADNNQQNNLKWSNCVAEVLDTYKNYGLVYLFNNIVDKLNLSNILKNACPKFYNQLMNLVYFTIAQHKSMLHCQDWIEDNGIGTSYWYSSQGISKLFDTITPKHRDIFFHQWLKQFRENEYLAVDITSISSYSETNEYLEFGYNRDHERLKQINLCTLFGQKSYLPIYQTEFNGSLNDVSTLKTIIYEFYSLISDYDFTLVMDK
jgi:hypothetical protein